MSKLLSLVLGCGLALASRANPVGPGSVPDSGTETKTFRVEGVVKELKTDGRTMVIAHDAIPNYMEAMTMPFKVKEQGELAGLRPGDRFSSA